MGDNIPVVTSFAPTECAICTQPSLEGVFLEKTVTCPQHGTRILPLFMCQNCVKTSLSYKNMGSLYVLLDSQPFFIGVFLN